MSEDNKMHGRVMRLPMFDGMLPTNGPVHLVSDAGDEYLLIADPSDTPGRVEDLAAACATRYEPHLDRDVTVIGDIFGSVIWNATIADGAPG